MFLTHLLEVQKTARWGNKCFSPENPIWQRLDAAILHLFNEMSLAKLWSFLQALPGVRVSMK